MIPVVLMLAAFAFMAMQALSSAKSNRDTSREFAAARERTPSWVEQRILGLSESLSRSNAVSQAHDSTFGQQIHTMLLAGGGTAYNGSVDVYLSVQMTMLFIGAIGMIATIAGLVPVWLGLTFALGASLQPYMRVRRAMKEHEAAVMTSLPEFADLLQMPLSAGNSTLAALDFTSRRTSGPVSDEVRVMLKAIYTQQLTEAEAFDQAGQRLGNPQAMAFFNALLQSYLEGTAVLGQLRKQAEAIREDSYQRKRAKAKQLPIKLVFIFAMHLLPMLLVMAILPLLTAFSQL